MGSWFRSAVVTGVLMLLVNPTAAWAHTDLEGTQPVQGAVVDSLDRVSVTFTQPVTPVRGGLGSETGIEFTAEAASEDDGRTWYRAVASGSGPQIVTYQFAAADGHILSGEFTFELIHEPASDAVTDGPTAAASPPATAGPTVSALDQQSADESRSAAGPTPSWQQPAWWLTRLALAMGMLGSIAGIGASLVGRRPTGRHAGQGPLQAWRPVGLLTLAAGLLLLLGGSLRVLARGWLTGAEVAAAVNPVNWSQTLGTHLEWAVALRLLAGVGFAAAGAQTLRSSQPSSSPTILGALASAAAVASFTQDGHTVSTSPVWLMALLSGSHVTAVGIWAGGVLTLAAMRRTSVADVISARLLDVAIAAVIVVAVSGLVSAALILPGPGALVTTGWGLVLLAKVALVGVVLALGLRHHRALHGGHAAARRAVGLVAESVAICGVIALSAVLVGLAATSV